MPAQRGFIPDEIAGGYTTLRKYHPSMAAGIAKPPLIIRIDPDSPHKAYLQNITITFQKKYLAGISWSAASFVLAHEVMHYMLRHSELVYGWITAGQVTGQWSGTIYTFPYHEITCQHSLDMVINDGLRTNNQMEVPEDAIIDTGVGDFRIGEANVYVREYKKKLDEEQKKQQKQQAMGNRPVPGGNGQPQPGQGKPSSLPGEPGQNPCPAGHPCEEVYKDDGAPCPGNTKGQYPTNTLVSCDGMGVVMPQNPSDIDPVKQQEIIRKFVEELTENGQGNLAGMIERLTEGLEETHEDWRKVIRPRVASAIGRDRETWTRFNQRALLVKSFRPALEGRRARRVCLGIDTSGSINAEMTRIFLSAFADMYEQITPKMTDLLEVDATVQCHTEFKTIPQMRKFIAERKQAEYGLMGGGGTDMGKINKWLVKHEIYPDITVIFTDGYTPFPRSLGNSKRVIWVMTTNITAPIEAGETIRFTFSN